MARSIPDDEKAQVKTISLPPDAWQLVDDYAAEMWRGNRSEAVYRIIQEWQSLKPSTVEKVLAGHEQPEPCAA